MGLATGATFQRTWSTPWWLGLLPVCIGALACSAGARYAHGVELYDSGWAVAPPVAQHESIIQSDRVPVGQLLPQEAIQGVVVPKIPPAARPPAASPPVADETEAPSGGKKVAEGPKLEWRPRTTAPAEPTPAPVPVDHAPVKQTPVEQAPVAQAPKPQAPKNAAPAKEAPAPKSLAEAFELPPREAPHAVPRPAPEAVIEAPRTMPGDMPAGRGGNLREPAPFPGAAAEPVVVDATPLKSAAPQSPTEPRVDRAPLTRKPATQEPAAQEPTAPPVAKAKPQAKSQSEEPAPRLAKRPSPTKQPTPAEAPSQPPTETTPRSAKPAPTAPPQATNKKQPPQESTPSRAKSARSTPPAARPLPPLSRSQQYLRRRIRSVLSYYYRRPLNNRDHDPWEMMHGMLAYGLHSRVLDTTNRNQPVTAIGYLCFNKPCKRKRLMHLTPEGQLDAEVAYGLQGHKGQFLAMLAQCNVSREYPIRVDGEEFTINDLIESEQRTCFADSELTFKLIALMHYLDSDAQWTNAEGEAWDLPKLIHEERNQPIRGAACGGTHRLSGLALAARRRTERGQPLTGEWLEAQRFTEQYQGYAFRLQNRDGSLSTEWFRGPGAEEDINRRVRTTGHILEWLIYSLPEEQLTEYRTVRAVNYLTSLLSANTNNPWEVGPLSHALHALKLYDERVFEPYDEMDQVARQNSRNNSRQPSTPNYEQITSRVYGTYPSHEEVKQALEEAENPGGLRGLLGIGSRGGRRSR